MLVCKYRVLSHVVKDTTTVRMSAVMPRSKYDPAGSPENALWSHATPSGELDLVVRGSVEEYPVGKAFLLTLTPDPKGDWWTNGFDIGSGGRVSLELVNGSSKFTASINAVPAAKALTDYVLPLFRAELEARVKDPTIDPWASGIWRWRMVIEPTDG